MLNFYTRTHTLTHAQVGGVVSSVGVYSLVSASPPQGQESGLISACHETCLSLHTHSGREVHFSSEKKPVNLTQRRCEMCLHCVHNSCRIPPSLFYAAVHEEVPPLIIHIHLKQHVIQTCNLFSCTMLLCNISNSQHW